MKPMFMFLAAILLIGIATASDTISLQGKLSNLTTNIPINGTIQFNASLVNVSNSLVLFSDVQNLTLLNGIWNMQVGRNGGLKELDARYPTAWKLQIGNEVYSQVNNTYSMNSFRSLGSNNSDYLGGQPSSFYLSSSEFIANNLTVNATIDDRIVRANASLNVTTNNSIITKVNQAFVKALGFFTSTDVDNSTIVRNNTLNTSIDARVVTLNGTWLEKGIQNNTDANLSTTNIQGVFKTNDSVSIGNTITKPFSVQRLTSPIEAFNISVDDSTALLKLVQDLDENTGHDIVFDFDNGTTNENSTNNYRWKERGLTIAILNKTGIYTTTNGISRADNVYFGRINGTYNETAAYRPLTSNGGVSVTVCPIGCNYSSIQDAVNMAPLVARDAYQVRILDGYYNEDVYVPPVIVSRRHPTEGAIYGIEIRGNTTPNDAGRVIVNSFQFAGCYGTWACALNVLTINGSDPHSDENISVAVYGTGSMIIGEVNFNATNVQSGILAYESMVYTCATLYKDNGYDYAIANKGGRVRLGDNYNNCSVNGTVKRAMVVASDNSFTHIEQSNLIAPTTSIGQGLVTQGETQEWYGVYYLNQLKNITTDVIKINRAKYDDFINNSGTHDPLIYSTNQNGSGYPFASLGNLIIQARTSAPRDILFYGYYGIMGSIRGQGNRWGIGGNFTPVSTLDVKGNTTLRGNLTVEGNISSNGQVCDINGNCISSMVRIAALANCTGTDKFSFAYPNGTLGCTTETGGAGGASIPGDLVYIYNDTAIRLNETKLNLTVDDRIVRGNSSLNRTIDNELLARNGSYAAATLGGLTAAQYNNTWAESDPQVGTTSNEYVCRSDSSGMIQCTTGNTQMNIPAQTVNFTNMGEGLIMTWQDGYWSGGVGTDDARIVRVKDNNGAGGAVDGGLVIEFFTPTDNTRLDGLALRRDSTATNGSITWANNTIWHAGNDGKGSGLEADSFDALDSTSFWQLTNASIILHTNTSWVLNQITTSLISGKGFINSSNLSQFNGTWNAVALAGLTPSQYNGSWNAVQFGGQTPSQYNGSWDAADQSLLLAGENITTGTVPDARIASTISRDSEAIILVNNANTSMKSYVDLNNASVVTGINNANSSMKTYVDLNNQTIARMYVNRTQWTSIDSYPAACSAGQFMTAIGDTVTCSVPISDNFALNTSVLNVTTQFGGSVTGTYSTIKLNDQTVRINAANVTTGVLSDARLPASQSAKNFTGPVWVDGQVFCFHSSAGVCDHYMLNDKECFNAVCSSYQNGSDWVS